MMRRWTVLIAPLFLLAILAGAPIHEIAAVTDHAAHTPCTDGVPVTHFDGCHFDPDGGICHLCVYAAGGATLAFASFPVAVPAVVRVAAAPEIAPVPNDISSLPLSRGPPAGAA